MSANQQITKTVKNDGSVATIEMRQAVRELESEPGYSTDLVKTWLKQGMVLRTKDATYQLQSDEETF
ncbi:MAG: hypothetical protein QOH63_1929 [Acidobacteriota bacterium]|jgi:hypothetical protein|nr:hypothetical protein [Acidobacteriota bacterium]